MRSLALADEGLHSHPHQLSRNPPEKRVPEVGKPVIAAETHSSELSPVPTMVK